MDAYEATKVVFSRIQALDPDHAAKIMGFLLIQDHGEKEMIRLVFGPEALLQTVMAKARKDLGLLPATPTSAAPLLTLLLLENTGGGAHDEGDDTESGEGAVPAAPPQRPEFWRESRNGECAAEVGVAGPDAGSRPRSLRALAMTVWSSASGPKARRIISFSPWSWMSRKPMILAAWSGSSAWIRENTTLVAS